MDCRVDQQRSSILAAWLLGCLAAWLLGFLAPISVDQPLVGLAQKPPFVWRGCHPCCTDANGEKCGIMEQLPRDPDPEICYITNS
jgi:hypothetical protein